MGVEVPSSTPSGFARRRGEILGGLIFLTTVYAVIYYIFQDSNSFLRPAEQFCPSPDEPCSRPDLLGFQVCSGIMQIFMGTSGFIAWHYSKRAHKSVPATPEGRLFGYLEDADQLNAGIFVYQMWDFGASLFIPEHATAVFLGHHIMAAITAYMSLEYQYMHHYAIFFGGCSEISSIFLVFCDFDVYFPASRGSVWGAFIMFCQAAFTLAFLYYRVIGWWQVSFSLWSDALHVLSKEDTAENYRPGSRRFIFAFLSMDLLLGVLQLYWFLFGILPKIAEILAEDDA